MNSGRQEFCPCLARKKGKHPEDRLKGLSTQNRWAQALLSVVAEPVQTWEQMGLLFTFVSELPGR